MMTVLFSACIRDAVCGVPQVNLHGRAVLGRFCGSLKENYGSSVQEQWL